MLIRITNRCHMGCSHCGIEASSPTGEHMTMETFRRAIEFCLRLRNCVFIISGGEPFEHPEVFEMLAWLRRRLDSENITGDAIIVASNGMFIQDPDLVAKVLQAKVRVQITNDARYYPIKLHEDYFRSRWLASPGVEVSEYTYEDRIRRVFPCRRTRENGIETDSEYPLCFNLRSVTRSCGDFRDALYTLAVRFGRCCIPAINVDGTVVAGEMDTCYPIGTIRSYISDLTYTLTTMRCDRCGLAKYLRKVHKEAIGLESLPEPCVTHI